MRFLFIAPIPPPIDGQSKVSNYLLNKLIADSHLVSVINLSKSSYYKSNLNTCKRFFSIFLVLINIFKKYKKQDIIYLSISESKLGNIRDLFIYLICYKNLNKLYIHMLGGAGMKNILERKGILQNINKYFISKIGGVIVEGKINYDLFSNFIHPHKIHIIPNFAEDYLFVNDIEIEKKFSNLNVIKILYLSNLLPGKGYRELVDAYALLNSDLQKKVEITFVGGFENIDDENNFQLKIKNFNGIKYLGKFIDGIDKREVYCSSHIFCLPTYYPFEGQPISILEAYSTGCVVITTNHSGIPFIFENGINGYVVEKESINSLKNTIEQMFLERNNLKSIAFTNRDQSLKKYRLSKFLEKINSIFINNLNS